MKPRKLPITLLGRIAQEGLSPQNVESLKAICSPISILDLMENNDWINKAFEQASSDAERAKSTAIKIRKFLDENTPQILEKWSEAVGRDKALRFGTVMSENEDFGLLVDMLAAVFATAGYVFAKTEGKNNET